MNQTLSQLNKTFHEVSTGKRLHRPSDDPAGVSRAMSLKSSLAANDQFQRNADSANLWLDETDQTVQQMTNVLQRVRELTVQGSNDILSPQDRTAIAIEVGELREQIRQFANTKVSGNYLFNGQRTNTAPFPDKLVAENNSYDTGAINFTVGEGIVVKGNVSADELFGNEDDESNLFHVLNSLIDGLKLGEKDLPLEQLDQGIDRMLAISTEVGTRKNRVEAAENRLMDSTIHLKTMLSKIEDVDLAEAITRLTSEESVYQASLAATARIVQPSLMDFLR